MSKEVADQLRQARTLIATPQQWITGIAEDACGKQTRYCLGGAICQILHGTAWSWTKGGAAFDVITAAILARHPHYEKDIVSYYRENGMEPTVIISRFNNTNPDGYVGVLGLLDAVIAELDPPKVPKPEDMKVRELEYA